MEKKHLQKKLAVDKEKGAKIVEESTAKSKEGLESGEVLGEGLGEGLGEESTAKTKEGSGEEEGSPDIPEVDPKSDGVFTGNTPGGKQVACLVYENKGGKRKTKKSKKSKKTKSKKTKTTKKRTHKKKSKK